MKGRVEVVCGGAGSGKTRWLLGIFREELRRLQENGEPGQAVWITPTSRSRRGMRSELLDATLGVCFAPNVLTFDAFAERLLQTTGLGITPLLGVAQRIIARTVIDETVAAKAVSYFAPIADTSGFLDLVLGLIAELKRDETEPDEFAAACRKRNMPRDAELFELYRRYQERLTSLALYDGEGRFWAARLQLAAGRHGGFDPLSLVVVDGFADFTQPQYEILEHLANYAQRVLISLPLEHPVARTDLFAKSAKALEEIRRRCPVEIVPPPASRSSGAAGLSQRNDRPVSLRHLADHLFDNPRTAPRTADAAGIEIIAAAGQTGETRAVALRVKQLLLDGVSAEHIVIATRSLDENGAELAGALESAGVPVACEIRTRFSQTSVGRAVFSVLEAELQDWSFDSLCSVLRSNYFRPRWEFPCTQTTVEAAIRTLRRYQLGSDRQHILKRLARLAALQAQAGSKPDPDAPVAARLLQAFSDATKRLRSPKDLTGWCDCLFGLADELGIEPPKAVTEPQLPVSPLDQRDRQEWEVLCEVLREAAQVRELLNDRRQMPLAAFVRLLRDLFESQALMQTPGEQNRVRVVEASDVRNLEVPYLFLMGLSEASFPRGRRDDCFYSAAERRAILGKDRSGAAPSTSQQDEMLLFYSIVTRARRCLTLSYPSVSASGQPLFPSPYVTAVQELFFPSEIKPSVHSDLDPLPSRDQILSVADLRLVATDELRSGRPGMFRAMVEQSTRGVGAGRGILAAADMDACRFEQLGFTQFEGFLQNGSNIAAFARKFSPNYQFSVTQLENYATCPFRFLLSQVLKLEPNDPIEPELDPRRRGLALHRVLAELHRPAAGSRSPALPDRAASIEALRRLVAAQFAIPTEIPAYERALQAAELEFAERFVELYSRQLEDYLAAVGDGWESLPAPRFVELAFGDVPDSDESPAPAAAQLPCVTFGTPESPVRVGGRIDRIDVGRRAGQDAFTVIDYKTRSGQRFHLADIEMGLALQLAIYTSAARAAGSSTPKPHRSRWPIGTSRSGAASSA